MLAAAGTGRLVIEVKNLPGEPDYTRDALAAQLLVAELARLQPGADIVISSFDPVAVDVARAAGWRTGLLTIPGVLTAGGCRLCPGARVHGVARACEHDQARLRAGSCMTPGSPWWDGR